MSIRKCTSVKLKIANAAAVSSKGGYPFDEALKGAGGVLTAGGDGIVDATEHTHGTVETPAAWTPADIGFLVSNIRNGTFVPLADNTGARVKISGIATAEAKQYRIPDDAFRAGFFKLVSLDTADGTNENQGAERTLVVTIKR